MTLDPYLSEGHAQYVWPTAHEASNDGSGGIQSARSSAPRRPPLARRRTALRLSGEFTTDASETRERFAGPKGVMPLRPARRPTNLRLEKNLEVDKMPTSESKAQFVHPGDPRQRPPPRRHFTSLKMEGDMDISPEYRTAYTEVQGDRPPMIKPKENLSTAQGQMFLETEKREMFKNPPEGRRRPALARHATNIKLGGSLEGQPEYKEVYRAPGTNKVELRRPEVKPTLGGTMTLGAALGESLTNTYPEYKDWYLDYPRRRPLAQKPDAPHNFRFDADLFRRRMPERRQTTYLPPPRRTVDSVCLDGYGGTGSRFNRPLVRFDSAPRLMSDSDPAFIVHPRDEAICNRRAVFPLTDSSEDDGSKQGYRSQKRVTLDAGDGEGTSSESADASGGAAVGGGVRSSSGSFRVLEASGLSTESDEKPEEVDERLTSMKLDEEGNITVGAPPEGRMDAVPPTSEAAQNQCTTATPLYCATANAPFYCTGASPPHHLYFGGFCPNWTQANGTPLAPAAAYCPSIVPPQGACPTAPLTAYCPAFLPPIHPYVNGCCPPPVQVMMPESNQETTELPVTAPTTQSQQTAEKPSSGSFVVLDPSSSDSNNNHLDRKTND